MPFAHPDTIHPVRLPDGTVHEGTVFLSAIVDHPRISIGDYTYMSNHAPLTDAAAITGLLAPYLYPGSDERLVIGKFCQIAHGVQCVTSSANHRYDGLTSYPFAIFDAAPGMMQRPSMPRGGRDTVIGNDVWLGTGALVLPGARIGDGVIVGAGAVVGGTVPPYTIVAGNPARILRDRLSRDDAARMQALAWWNWPIERILAHEADLCAGDVARLEAIAAQATGGQGSARDGHAPS